MAEDIGGGGLSGLFQNKMFLQFLGGLGQDISTFGANTDKGMQFTHLGAATQENIKSQSMLKLLKQALGPDESSLKASNKGLTINIPNAPADPANSSSAPENNPFADAVANAVPNTLATSTVTTPNPFTVDQALAPAVAPVAAVPSLVPTSVTPNPFTSINPADLAGLSPQEILSVVGAKHAQDTLKQQSYRDMVAALYAGKTDARAETAAPIDNKYKGALTNQSIAAATENTPSVTISYGDSTFKVTPKDAIAWEKMKKETTPNEMKLYDLALKQGFVGSIVDFKNSDMTTHQKDYEKAKSEGYDKGFTPWLLDMAKAGAINLGTKVEEKKTLSELGGQLYFNDPKWTEDVHKQTAAFDKDQAWVIPEKDRPLARSKVVVKTVEDKIAAGSGAIQSVTMDKDGKTMVWTVKWPSGDTKTIKQAVR
jgi:hypothetical protein